MRRKYSDYMHWAKTQGRARFNLATSGVGGYPLRDLQLPPGGLEALLEINSDAFYGYPPLLAAIAAKSETTPDCVVTAPGTSMANHLAMAALLEPGDEVLIEDPTYELLLSAAEYLGAAIQRFPRREENGYAIDPADVRRTVTPKTKLIVLTNLHNPTGVLTAGDTLRAIAGLGPTVLVDEVYLDAVFENPPRSAFHAATNVVITNSLTKMYGLSGLRCGWILAQPDLARAIWRLNDLFGVNHVHPAEQLSVIAFQQLDAILQRSRRVIEADRACLAEFLRHNPGFSAPETRWGTTAFLRPNVPDAGNFLARLRGEYETSVVPGYFFGDPRCFRVGMGVESGMFARGLANIAALNRDIVHKDAG